MFCGFVAYDTQLIVRKARSGDQDSITHALDLFINFQQVFRNVLILDTIIKVRMDGECPSSWGPWWQQ